MRESDAARSASRAKARMRDACMMIRADTMMTLTFQENVTDLTAAWKAWHRFSRYLKKYHWATDYVIVHELQQRGALHFHVALRTQNAWMPYTSLIEAWRRAIKGVGSVKITRDLQCRERQRPVYIYGYLAKYLGKNFLAGEMNRKRYEISRGCPEPAEEITFMPVGDDTPHALSRVLAWHAGRKPMVTWTKPGLIYLRSF